MDLLTSALTGIFLPIFLGVLARRKDYIAAKNRPVLQQFAVRIAIPALVFSSLSTMDTGTAGQFLPMSLGLFLFFSMSWSSLFLLIFLLQKKSAWVKQFRSELLIMAFTGNLAYICWRLHELVIGPEGLQRGIFYTAFYWPFLLTFSFLSIAVFGLKQQKSLDRRELLYNVTPVLVFMAAGLAVGISGVRLPLWLSGFVSSFGNMAIPLVLFGMGLSLTVGKSLRTVGYLIPFLFLRLALWIGATLVMVQLPWFDEPSRGVLMINALAPLGVNPIIIGDMFGMDTEFIANSTIISTLLFLLFIPVIFFLWA
ncbi:AEC family transporter [Spirochaeta isovalerica]|uniref:Uncharacterized protein n=1 Tax=Spirochaeta isovalerica TaxID=150 RepID=A0A841R8E6_9SPIO|nr:hypothetical protein [Spirochaeta isovalerica]MBB6481554.1 hypothetical protein [Spirochaeta isovalerica]